ncbi:DUF4192 domain-containing protein [Streptomyces sp. CMB-StM0423]|uniref:DUF4192 domain-containing protein n=1 Tax=Streptomyces sp. CMB-StM0423 TaxID=2059884 RepID=UPI000C71410A|nr:DUF4192 domain-containing protein [Streptomyces sp. CMB-StM0423]AUH40102.1 DUF4192 domain-containing protein [Streptomyces sp. CMB-StM0423]
MTTHNETQVVLRSPAELADALPYLMGFHPDDSVVLAALHGEHGRFGGRLRLGIPPDRDGWRDVAAQLAECLIEGSAKRGDKPDGIVVFLCQDPGVGEQPREVMERLRSLAQRLRVACGRLEVPVVEALCISAGRFWSYLCPDESCCPPEGTELVPPGSSAMAAAAAYAGLRRPGSLRALEGRIAPRHPDVDRQTRALDAAGGSLVPRILEQAGRETVRAETLALTDRLIARLTDAPPPAGEAAADTDERDDRLLTDDECAALIVGLQDRLTRDRAAERMEGEEAAGALRLWRALSRRCIGAYVEHAAAPLTLAGWVAWSSGDEAAARVALGCALVSDPEYLFARLLHQAINEGLDPEPLRRSLRRQRRAQEAAASPVPAEPGSQPPAAASRSRARARPLCLPPAQPSNRGSRRPPGRRPSRRTARRRDVRSKE